MQGDRSIQSEVTVSSVRFLSRDRLAGTCADGKVRVWDARSGDLKKVVAQDVGDTAIVLVENTHGCASVGSDGAVKVWDLNTGGVVRRQAGPEAKVKIVAVSRDGNLIAASGPVAEKASESAVRLWDRIGKERFVVPAGLGDTSAMAFSPDGATLVAGGWDTDLTAWSTGTGKLVARIEELSVSMFALGFSPDGKVVAAAGVDRVVRMFDTKTWKVTRTLTGQPEMILSLAFSKDGRLLATGGFSELGMKRPAHVVLWDVAAGRVIRTVPAPHFVTAVAFSDDGALLASVSGEKAIALRHQP
jgi:WD40 repeat protein